MQISFNGLVLKETDYGESDKLLTVLSAEYGKITVNAKGLKSQRGLYRVPCMPFCYSEFTVYKKGDRFWLREASLNNEFIRVRSRLETCAAAQYFADVLDDICVENEESGEYLRLGLNTLYRLGEENSLPLMIKAVFELRCVLIGGVMPDLDGCAECGKKEGRMYLDVMNGVLKCPDCVLKESESVPIVREGVDASGTATVLIPLSFETVAAMKYVLTCPPKRIFAFSLDREFQSEFCTAAEKYTINHLGHSFKTLEFFKEVIKG